MNHPAPHVLLPALLLSACAASQSSPQAGDAQRGMLKIYGNFCGPGHPSVSGSTREERVAELKDIPARDSLDDYCKQHDLCYTETFYLNSTCDRELIERARALATAHAKAQQLDAEDTGNGHKQCALMAELVADYFQAVHPSRGSAIEIEQVEGWAGKLITSPFTITSLGANSLELVIYGGPPELSCSQTITVTDSDGVTHRITAGDGL